MQFLPQTAFIKVNPKIDTEERRLAERCRCGDEAAFKELYDRYAGRLMAICLRYVTDRATAEDLLHDTYLKIFGAVVRFEWRGPGSLKAWMERIAVNVALEWLRNRNRLKMNAIEDSRVPHAGEEPAAEEVERIPREVLMRMVGELPDGYRTIFNLFCIEGYSHREIAAMLGIREKSSSSQLFRARAILARRIEDYLKSH